jgi:thiol-disulfide isomerase/thioredoxin/uncharacterized membrane protein YphA (DoxX/SURF4 family)
VGSFVLAARVFLAVVFVTAAVAKLLDRHGSRHALANFGVPERALPVAALLLPLAELATAAALVPRPSARWGALAALVVLGVFIAGIANAMRRGQAPDCHCFGQLHSAPAGPATLARNSALAVLAAIAVWEGPGPAIDDWAAARTAAELAAVGAGAAAAVLAALALRLWLDNRGLRRDLAAARAEGQTMPPGLPVGAPAPDFALSSAKGKRVTLQSLLADGHPVALMFVDPECGPCQTLLPEVGRWQATLANRLTVAVVSRGTPQENLPTMQEHGITDILLQEDSEVMSAYRLQGTPSAVVVTTEGKIASDSAEGIVTIEPMIRLTLQRVTTPPAVSPSAA